MKSRVALVLFAAVCVGCSDQGGMTPDQEKQVADVNAIAAPLRDIRNGRWLVLSSSGPASSMDEAYFRNIVAPKLRTLAARLA